MPYMPFTVAVWSVTAVFYCSDTGIVGASSHRRVDVAFFLPYLYCPV
jgi:hypothetical protein